MIEVGIQHLRYEMQRQVLVDYSTLHKELKLVKLMP